MRPTVCFVSASRQNIFFAELLDALADALEGLGVAVERSVDCFPQLRDDLVYVFVPHELLPLLMADAHPSEPQLRRSVTICTEQPGTNWFDESARISQRAGATIDINRMGVAALKRHGVHANFLQLGYTPRWDHWHESDSERPVELAFLAGVTPRRLSALASCARELAGRRTELHLPEAMVPHQAGSEFFLSGARKWELLRRSKLLMNVHRSELGYFEWQRAIEAMINGCVLLSEHSLGFDPLIPGEHFVSVSFNSLDVALAGLIDDEDRLRAMRASARSFLQDEHPLSKSIEVLADAVGEVVARPATLTTTDRDRPAAPRPKPPQNPLPEYERIAQGRGELDVLRMATKQLLLEQREMRKMLRDLRLTVEGEDLEEDVVEELGPEAECLPRVSVVITVYNYAAVVADAIDSVAVSDFTDFELVIVDDASTDGSADAIRSALERAPWVRAKLITRSQNQGLARHAISAPRLRPLTSCSSWMPTTRSTRMLWEGWCKQSTKSRRSCSRTGSSSSLAPKERAASSAISAGTRVDCATATSSTRWRWCAAPRCSRSAGT